jgi:hypothetical protein
MMCRRRQHPACGVAGLWGFRGSIFNHGCTLMHTDKVGAQGDRICGLFLVRWFRGNARVCRGTVRVFNTEDVRRATVGHGERHWRFARSAILDLLWPTVALRASPVLNTIFRLPRIGAAEAIVGRLGRSSPILPVCICVHLWLKPLACVAASVPP